MAEVSPTGEVTLRVLLPYVGLKRIRTQRVEQKLSLVVDGKSTTRHTESRRVIEEEVLAVEGSAVSKVRATYRAASLRAEGVTTDLPFLGKVFEVTSVDGRVLLRSMSGEEIREDDRNLLVLDFAGLGLQDFTLGIPERALVRQSRVPELEASMQKFLSEVGKRSEGARYSGVRVAMLGTDGKKADFSVAWTLEKDGPLKVTGSQKGRLTLSLRNAWPLSIELEGPALVSSSVPSTPKTPGSKMSGKGTVTTQTLFEYP